MAANSTQGEYVKMERIRFVQLLKNFEKHHPGNISSDTKGRWLIMEIDQGGSQL
jgi:hypothetical protein